MTKNLDELPFPISLLSNVLFGLAAMLDSGKHDGITIDDVKHHAFHGDLVEFLKAEAGGYFASNVLDPFPNFRRWYVEKIAENCVAMDGRERRKCGVDQRGLCLLVSYTAEIIQSNNAPLEITSLQSRPLLLDS